MVQSYFSLPTAAAGFFLSSWLLMIFAGIVSSDVGIKAYGYPTAMVLTIGLWLVIAPAAGAIAGARGGAKHGR